MIQYCFNSLIAIDYIASLFGVEVGDLGNNLDDVLAVNAEDLLGLGNSLYLDLALGAGVPADEAVDSSLDIHILSENIHNFSYNFIKTPASF